MRDQRQQELAVTSEEPRDAVEGGLACCAAPSMQRPGVWG